MRLLTTTIIAAITMLTSALADTWRVQYTARGGQGHSVTVEANNSSEARMLVQAMLDCTVTNVRRVR
jgi:hypothetical protein